MDNLTENQKEQLVSFMETNEDFAKGRITQLSVQGKQTYAKWK